MMMPEPAPVASYCWGPKNQLLLWSSILLLMATTDGMAFSTMSETSSTALTRVLLTVWLPPSEPSAAASVSAGAVVSSVLAGFCCRL